MSDDPESPRLFLRLTLGAKGRFGPGKAELLERIARSGSISAAGREMNMSYKRAWSLVEEMNALFREPLIERTRGGAGGGASGGDPRPARGYVRRKITLARRRFGSICFHKHIEEGVAMSPRVRRMLFALMLGTAAPVAAQAEAITVFAAASLKNALDPIAADWQASSGDTVAISYGGSSALAKQIQQGAPADIFISAAVNWMDKLEEAQLLQPDSRKTLLGNSLVLIAAGSDAAPVTLGPELDLAGLLKGGKLAMANVDAVPAGQYGKQALTTLGLWPSVEASVAQAADVRAALAFVTTGEAPFGIVYATDAMADDAAGNKATVVATFPEASHDPILYPAALTRTAKPAAKGLFDYLASDAAGAVFAAQGFTLPQ